jgi:probable rRNA maturation factor
VGIKRAVPFSGALSQRACEFLKVLRVPSCELSLSVVSDVSIRGVNKKWRGKDKATDVLSFPVAAIAGVAHATLGDVVISIDTAKRMAKKMNTTMEHELDLYLAHGILHLLGYDHQTKRDSKKMAQKERLLLSQSGMLLRSE